MRKLRLKEIKSIAQSHPASKVAEEDLDHGLISKPVKFPMCSVTSNQYANRRNNAPNLLQGL